MPDVYKQKLRDLKDSKKERESVLSRVWLFSNTELMYLLLVV